MKAVNYIILVAFAAVLIYASFGLPNRGDAAAPLNGPKSLAGTPNAPTHYIQNPELDAETPNMVTVILADYRGYDTMGEETVILTAGLICFLILRKSRKQP